VDTIWLRLRYLQLYTRGLSSEARLRRSRKRASYWRSIILQGLPGTITEIAKPGRRIVFGGRVQPLRLQLFRPEAQRGAESGNLLSTGTFVAVPSTGDTC
jgi:hypothetical protein